MLRDDSYQETLPYHARHTASTSIKSNTRLTQFIQNEDINTGKQMNYYALENYLYNKENSLKYLRIFYHSCYEVIFCVKLEVSNCMKEKHKMEQPERYDLVPTLNDLGQLRNIFWTIIFPPYFSSMEKVNKKVTVQFTLSIAILPIAVLRGRFWIGT